MNDGLGPLENSYVRADPAFGSARAFGLTFAAVFLVVGWLPLFRHGHVRLWSLALAGLVLLVALTYPSLLAPLNRAWASLGVQLNRVTTPVLMALVFLIAVTPVALLRRAFGRSGLALRFEPELETYWIARARGTLDADSLKRQF